MLPAIVLDGNKVTQPTVEYRRPDFRLHIRVDQVGDDTDSAPGPAQTAAHEMGCTKFGSQTLMVGFILGQLESGNPGDNLNLPDTAQTADQLLSKPVAKVPILRIFAETTLSETVTFGHTSSRMPLLVTTALSAEIRHCRTCMTWGLSRTTKPLTTISLLSGLTLTSPSQIRPGNAVLGLLCPWMGSAHLHLAESGIAGRHRAASRSADNTDRLHDPSI